MGFTGVSLSSFVGVYEILLKIFRGLTFGVMFMLLNIIAMTKSICHREPGVQCL